MSFQPDRLRQQRKALGLSQAQLAAQIGIDQRQISYLEGENSNPTATTLAALAKALNVTSDWLLGLTELSGTVAQNSDELDETEREAIQILRSKPQERRKKILEMLRLIE